MSSSISQQCQAIFKKQYHENMRHEEVFDYNFLSHIEKWSCQINNYVSTKIVTGYSIMLSASIYCCIEHKASLWFSQSEDFQATFGRSGRNIGSPRYIPSITHQLFIYCENVLWNIMTTMIKDKLLPNKLLRINYPPVAEGGCEHLSSLKLLRKNRKRQDDITAQKDVFFPWDSRDQQYFSYLQCLQCVSL